MCYIYYEEDKFSKRSTIVPVRLNMQSFSKGIQVKFVALDQNAGINRKYILTLQFLKRS